MTSCYYTTGINGKEPALISIELLKKTDVSNLLYKPHRLETPAFTGGLINCGKVHSIVSIANGRELKEATVIFGDGTKALFVVSKYFNLEGYRYEENKGLPVYRTKAGALNGVDYVDTTFSGVRYFYYSGGMIHQKCRYKNGDLEVTQTFRDDLFNTLESVTLKDGTTLSFDSMEQPILQESQSKAS